jgi:hypothetical protein
MRTRFHGLTGQFWFWERLAGQRSSTLFAFFAFAVFLLDWLRRRQCGDVVNGDFYSSD